MNAAALGELMGLLQPHVVAVALIGARLLPLTFLCPLFGGAAAPQSVKLGLVLSLALGVHFAGAVAAPDRVLSTWTFVALAARESALGVAMGLVAGLPFDAARMGGRFIDLFRGTSAEASLPATGTRESATGDGLYQLLTALAVTGVGLPLVVGAVMRSFSLVPLGGALPTQTVAFGVVRLATAALGGGLALGAPVAGLVLAVDCLLGLVSRAAPQLHLQEVGGPLKILGGGALLWLGIGALADRAVAGVAGSADALAALLAGLP